MRLVGALGWRLRWALLVGIAGCAGAGPPHPAARPPPPAPLPVGSVTGDAGSPPPSLAELEHARKRANDGIQGPPWRLEGAHAIAGLLVERWSFDGGPTTILSRDPAGDPQRGLGTVIVESWIPIDRDPAMRRIEDGAQSVLCELLRPTPLDERQRAVELLGARTELALEPGAARLRTTLSGGVDLIDRTSRAIAIDAQRIRAPRLPERSAWTRLSRQPPSDRGARALVSRQMRERIAGRAEEHLALDGLDADGARRLLAELATPDRVLVVVEGAFDRVAVLTALHESWAPAGAARGAPARARPAANLGSGGHPRPGADPPGGGRGRAELEVPGEEDLLLLAWPLREASADVVALQAIGELLGHGDGARLGRGGLAEHTYGVEVRPGPETFEIFATLQPGRTASVAAAMIHGELAAIARGESTGLELEIARASLRARLLSALDHPESRAGALGRAALSPGGLGALERQLGAGRELDEPALRRIVARHLAARDALQLEGRAKRGAR